MTATTLPTMIVEDVELRTRLGDEFMFSDPLDCDHVWGPHRWEIGRASCAQCGSIARWVNDPRKERSRRELCEYIEARSVPIPFAGCWMWLLSCGNHGYGNVCRDIYKSGTAHRLSYEAFKGPIPDGTLIQHSCDNRWCVNPDHLSVGTAQTNHADMHRKGRANLEGRKFPPHPKRKLTSEEVLAIRASTESLNTLSRRYGIWKRAVHQIKKGMTYRDVTKPEGREV